MSLTMKGPAEVKITMSIYPSAESLKAAEAIKSASMRTGGVGGVGSSADAGGSDFAPLLFTFTKSEEELQADARRLAEEQAIIQGKMHGDDSKAQASAKQKGRRPSLMRADTGSFKFVKEAAAPPTPAPAASGAAPTTSSGAAATDATVAEVVEPSSGVDVALSPSNSDVLQGDKGAEVVEAVEVPAADDAARREDDAAALAAPAWSPAAAAASGEHGLRVELPPQGSGKDEVEVVQLDSA